MWINILFLVTVVGWIANPVQTKQSYLILNNDTTTCDPMYNACFTLQKFARSTEINSSQYLQQNMTINFAPGKHFLTGGIELNNTASVVITGFEAEQLPEITCEKKSCFSFRNTYSILIQRLKFTECLNDNSDGGVLFISDAVTVNISQCSFTNNLAHSLGGAIRLQRIESAVVLDGQFVNNSVTRYPFTCSSNQFTASCGAIAADSIDSFFIENSKFSSNTAFCSSGAVCSLFSNTSVIGSVFNENNATVGAGGGVFIKSSEIRIDNCTFANNSANEYGGAVYVDASYLEVYDSHFYTNTGGNGGAVYSSFSILTFFSSSFFTNTVTGISAKGGAADFLNTSLIIDSCEFSKNEAHLGGAINIKNAFSEVIISRSTFKNNEDLQHCGGAICLQLTGKPPCSTSCNGDVTPASSDPIVHVQDCSFISNSGFRAGAIDATGGVLNVSESEFRENRGLGGGAISSLANFVYIQTSNFNGNTALIFGGALYVNDGFLQSDSNRFSSNIADIGDGSGIGAGGAIVAFTSTIYSRNDLYFGNKAITIGGAISGLQSDVSCTSCTFSTNAVLNSGGAIYLSQGTLRSIDSTYQANSAGQNGGALYTNHTSVSVDGDYYSTNDAKFCSTFFQADETLQLQNTTFVDNTALDSDRAYTVQLTNVRGNCGNLFFSRNIGSFYLFYSRVNFTGSALFTDNTGKAGGALSLVQGLAWFEPLSTPSIMGNTASNGAGVFLFQSELRVSTSFLRVDNNTANVSGGGMYGYQSQIIVDISNSLEATRNEGTDSDSVLFRYNSAIIEGGGLNAFSTSLDIMGGSVKFIANMAVRGGAIALSEGSNIKNLKSTEEIFAERKFIELVLSNNTAQYGGAIYVADGTNSGVLCKQFTTNRIQSISTEECFVQTLGLYFLRSFHYRQFNYMNIFFEFNMGTIAGSDIFGGLLDRCQINTFSEVRNVITLDNKLSGFDLLKLIAQFQIDFNYDQVTHPFNPQLIINNITRSHVKGLISSDPVQICFCEGNTYDCTYQWPIIFAKRGESFSVRAVAVDQVQNPVNGTAVASIISDGTQLKVDQTQQNLNGVCTDLVYNVFSTKTNAQIQLYPMGPCENRGISSKNISINFLRCDCPNGLQPAPLDNECRCECDSTFQLYISKCQLDNETISIVRSSVDFWIQYADCNNVSGFLLIKCPYDYCIDKPVNLSFSLPLDANEQCAFNRSGIMCGQCEEGLSLVFGSSKCIQCSNSYLALLVAFAFAGVALVAFILMLNMTVAVGTIHGLILYANIVAANSPVLLPTETALRLFVSWVNLDLGIETCFYDGMDSYAKVLLQLAFPTYIILLSILIIILSNYWGWFAKLIGGRKNPVATLCTLFLLSYSKLLRTTIASLQFTYLTYPDGSSEILWLYNPNILYFSLSRIPFFIFSIIIIISGSVYTTLLFFGQWIRKIEDMKLARCFQSNKYNAFLDAYHGPFVTKYRYWIGILLLTRIIHHVLSSVLDESTHLLVVSSLICALLMLKQILTEVYRKWFIGFVETSYLINLLLFSVSTYYASTTNGDQVAVANTSVAIAFITFIGIVMYHTHTYLLKSLNSYMKVISAIKQCLKKLKQKATNTNTAVANNDDVAADELETSMHLSLLREPALDIIAPVSTNDYSPPVVFPASDSKPPVSSTTVEIKK